jgi:beta-galactosidase
VPLPQGEPWDPSPSLALDYLRFMSDSYVRYQAIQAALLRRHSDGQFITHNFMGFKFPEIDYGKLSADLDRVSWDNYPSLDADQGRVSAALAADAMRGLKRRKVWVMEQQAGAVGWGQMRSPAPGQVRLWTYQAIAHGAEAVLFFRWRTARFGTEQHWHGILDASGDAGHRYRELRRISGELRELGPLLEATTPVVEAALLHDYDSRFALQVQPTNGALGYEATIRQHYQALRGLGLGVDVLPDASHLDRYRMVIAPSLYLIDPEVASALNGYVQGGGTLVLAPRTAVKDRFSVTPERPLPVWLDDLAGVRVTDYQSVSAEQRVAVSGAVAGEVQGWFEEIELNGAESLARYSDGAFAGSPAFTEHETNGGRAVYLGGAATAPTLDRLYVHLASRLGLSLMQLPDGLEVVRLEGLGDGELLMVLNHTETEHRLDFNGYHWHDHFSDAIGEDAFAVGPYGVALLECVRMVGGERVR